MDQAATANPLVRDARKRRSDIVPPSGTKFPSAPLRDWSVADLLSKYALLVKEHIVARMDDYGTLIPSVEKELGDIVSEITRRAGG